MKLGLDLKTARNLTKDECTEIDQFIEQAIQQHSKNSAQIGQLTMDCVTALTASEARANELEQQGFFKRLWDNVNGKNQKIQAKIDKGIAKSQYASQQIIQKLAEQNLLTFDMVTAVNNKLNSLIIEHDQEINNIYKTLIAFFKQTRADIVQHKEKIEKLEKNVDLLNWNATVEYQIYNGVEYSQLPNIEKIICLTNDFYHITKGKWSTVDLMLLKSTLMELGLPIKAKISANDFFMYLLDRPSLIDRLFDGISLDGLNELAPYEIPLIKGIEKSVKIQGEEKYIYESVVSQLDLAQVTYEKRSIQISIVHNYLSSSGYVKSDSETEQFDFVLELLTNIRIIDNASKDIIVEDEYSQESSDKVSENIYDVFLFNPGEAIVEVTKLIAGYLEVDLHKAKELVKSSPTIILSELEFEKADKVKNQLEKLGAIVQVKTIIEEYLTVVAPKDGIFTFGDHTYATFINDLRDIIFEDNKKYEPTAKNGDKVNYRIGTLFSGNVFNYIKTTEELLERARIYGMPNVNGEDYYIDAVEFKVKGEIVGIMVNDPEVVRKGQPLFVIRVDE